MNQLKSTLRGLLVAATLMSPTMSNAANVTIQVFKSDGTPFQGVAHTYYATYGYNMGNTNAAGQITYTVADGTYEFKVTTNGTTKSVTTAVSGNQTLTFYSTAVNATVQSCTGTPLAGVALKHAAGAYQYHFPASTNAQGQTKQELFPGTYDVTATWNGTSETKSVVVGGNGLTAGASSSVMFNPTTLTLGNTGSKTYKVGAYSYYANGTVYLFPGTYEFTFPGNYKKDLTIGGCAQNMTVNILVLKDHNNDPLTGGTARGGSGTNFSSFHVSGSTNAEGVLFDVRNNAPAQMSYEMRYNTTTKVLTQTSNNVYSYQTNELKLKLETCNGAPVAGGSARFGHGSNATSFYFPGTNSTDANGIMSAEFFPGTYSFEMGVSSSTEVKSSVVLPDADTTLTWKTTTVTLNWPYAISYGGSGDSRFFNGPSMELLPCTLNFNFRMPGANNYVPLTISGCSMSLTPGVIRLVNSNNQPLSGGTVEGYQNNWSTYGTTGSNGNVLILAGDPTSLRMTYAFGSQTINGVHFVTNGSVYTFQTKNVTVELTDANGGHLEGTGLSYYANGWRQFGSGSTTNGTATMQLLPIPYSFKLSYEGGTQQINSQDVNSNPLVSYQTRTVTMELTDANGGHLEGTGLSYYANGWRQFGSGVTTNGVATKQLLPLDYSFKLTYQGATQQISNRNVGTDPLIGYQTRTVTMELKDASGNPLEGTNLSFYSDSWRQFGAGVTTNGVATMQLLPRPYTFRLSYMGKSQDVNSQDIEANPLVSYQTVPVTVSLTDQNGNPLEGGIASVYSGSWLSMGNTNAEGTTMIELLPGLYSFKMAYNGQGKQIANVLLPNTPVVDFVYMNNTNTFRTSNTENETLTEEPGTEIASLNLSRIDLYPNPATEKLNIKFFSTSQKEVSVNIVDITGKVVIAKTVNATEGSNVFDISVSQLSTGTYFLKLGNVNVDAKKFAVQH